MAKKPKEPTTKRSTKDVSEKEWQEMEARFLRGESARKLAPEFNLPESSIRSRLAHIARAKCVAKQVVEADQALRSLPLPTQIHAQSLIDELKAVSYHLGGAAKYGASTAHRLAGIANQQIDQINEADPLGDEESAKALKSISILTSTANSSASLGMDLLKVNAEKMAELAKQEENKALAKQSRTSLKPDDAYKRMLNANA